VKSRFETAVVAVLMLRKGVLAETRVFHLVSEKLPEMWKMLQNAAKPERKLRLEV